MSKSSKKYAWLSSKPNASGKGQYSIDLLSCVRINRLVIKIRKEKDPGNSARS
jgi:hypothetical protein